MDLNVNLKRESFLYLNQTVHVPGKCKINIYFANIIIFQMHYVYK